MSDRNIPTDEQVFRLPAAQELLDARKEIERKQYRINCLEGDVQRLLGILREVRDNVRTVDLMSARDRDGNYTNLNGRIDAELTALKEMP